MFFTPTFRFIAASQFFIVFFLLPLTALAQTPDVVISEIAASLPSDEEWIEIYNTTDRTVDVGAWRFVEGFTESDPEGVRHKLNSYRGDAQLLTREYAIIANNAAVFMEKHQNFSGALFDSSWSSLKESGEKVRMIDGNGFVVEEFSYLPAQDGILVRKDPLSADYSLVNWAIVQGDGTPGKPYDALALPSSAPLPDSTAHSLPSREQQPFIGSQKMEPPPPEPPTSDAGANVAARVGETIIFNGSRSYDSKGEALAYSWDFGDGTKAAGAIIEHAFASEGDYSVRLTVSNGAGDDSDDVRVTVVSDAVERAVPVNGESPKLTPADAAVLPSKVEAVIEGIVTVEPGIFAKTYFYIASKDGRDGIQVYAADGAFPPDIHIGQLIEATGTVSSYYGVKRIITRASDAISVIRGADPPPAEEVAVSVVGDSHLGRLITVVGRVLKEDGKIFAASDDGARMRVEVKPETGISKTDLQEGAVFSLTGIVDKTRSGLRFLPRYPGDIIVVASKDGDVVTKNSGDAVAGVSNESRALGEKSAVSLPDIEYNPHPNTLDYTTEARSRSPAVKYLIATALSLTFVLIGIFMRERQNT